MQHKCNGVNSVLNKKTKVNLSCKHLNRMTTEDIFSKILCNYNESLSNVFIVKSNSLFSIDVNVVFSKLTSIVFVYFIENTKI